MAKEDGMKSLVLGILLGAMIGFWVSGFVAESRTCTVEELRK